MSDRLLKIYLDTLDYNKLFFTQQDIDGFDEEVRPATLDDDIWLAPARPRL